MLHFLAEQISTRRSVDGKRQDRLKNVTAALKEEFDLQSLDISTVSRWERELWESGALVEWADYNSLWRGERHKGDEEELIKEFKLKEAIVVAVNHQSTDDRKDTKLLYALANEAADEVRRKEEYRNIRHLALGSGRAMMRYAESIMGRPPQASSLTISPISGRLWVGDIWTLQEEADAESHLEAPLDADFSALFIARGLHQAGRKNIRLSQVSHFAYMGDAASARAVAKLRCAFTMNGKWNWGLSPPNRIVFGAASTDAAEHRITKFLERTLDKAVKRTVADSVKERFKEALSLANELGLPPIADFSVPLFATVPLPEEHSRYSLDAKNYRQVTRALKQLNAMTVAVNFSHLRSAVDIGGFTQLIAGGESKRRLIWTLLLPCILKPSVQVAVVNSVCTDIETARSLRQALRAVNADSALRDKYAALAKIIFS